MSKRKTKKRKKILKRTILFIILDLLAFTGFFLMYGPFNYFRNLYVSTAMNTMDHQWLAKIFFSDETIEKIMSRGTVNKDYLESSDKEIKAAAERVY